MKLLEKGVEAAKLAVMGELDIGNVVGDRRFFLSDFSHLRGRNVQELGLRIDEAPHEPGAGDAVDLRPLARHPARGGIFWLGGNLAAFLAPMLDASLEVARVQ